MDGLLPTMPISALRKNQSEIIEQLEKSPKVLTNNGYEAAVLMSPAQYREMVALVRRLEDSQIINLRLKEMDQGHWISGDEVEKQLEAKGLLS